MAPDSVGQLVTLPRVPGDDFDYVRYDVSHAARHLADARGRRVLVVGCNAGRNVSLFLDAGAREA
jgi:hypothetical protein